LCHAGRGRADDTKVIVAIVHDTGINTGIHLYFMLQPDGTLWRFLVEDFTEFPL
jgi:hypothetical protein